jgi:hypothetical protein
VYSYQIIDSIGCVYPSTITVNEPLPFTVVEQTNDVSCFGESDGSVSLIITGATSPYNINWFGYNTFGMQAGSYNFTIVDSNNCQYSEIVIINEPNPIDVTFTITSPSCLYSTNGMISLSIVGGTFPYTENWNGYNPNLLVPGTYEIIIVDANGCTDTNNIPLVPLSDMLIIEQSNNVTCEGFCDGSADLSINNGVLPYQSNWFGYNPDSLCPGFYFFEIIDGLGCIYSDSILITSPDSLDLEITENNGILSAAVVGGIAPFSYSWFNQVNQLGTGLTLNTSYYGDYYCVAYDNQNCQSDTVIYSYTGSPLNVPELNDSYLKDFIVYPNPNNGILNIKFSVDSNINFSLSLINFIGQSVTLEKQDLFNGKYVNHFDLSKHAKGIYLLEMKTENIVIKKKLILQ